MGVKGAILGDIIGSQYEFSYMRPRDLDWQNVPLISKKCKRTDDTILTLATKGAILSAENKGIEITEKNFVKWYYNMGNNYEGGYGGMFREWLHSNKPKPYDSFGNGSAMRVSFVGEHYDNMQSIYCKICLNCKQIYSICLQYETLPMFCNIKITISVCVTPHGTPLWVLQSLYYPTCIKHS